MQGQEPLNDKEKALFLLYFRKLEQSILRYIVGCLNRREWFVKAVEFGGKQRIYLVPNLKNLATLRSLAEPSVGLFRRRAQRLRVKLHAVLLAPSLSKVWKLQIQKVLEELVKVDQQWKKVQAKKFFKDRDHSLAFFLDEEGILKRNFLRWFYTQLYDGRITVVLSSKKKVSDCV